MFKRIKNVYSDLRRSAEERVGSAPQPLPEIGSAEELRAIINALRVHQIELEMQNDELRKTQRDLEAARDRYSRLYHQARWVT